MRKNFGSKTFMYPMPVLIIGTYGEDGTPDAMNAAWGGICDTGKIMLSLAKSHKTYKNIMNKKAFTVSIADSAHVAECDYVGIVSANNVPDKFYRAGFHAKKSEFVDAPVIEELPMTLECRLEKTDEDGLVIGEIVNVSADESILDVSGKIDPSKFTPITFDPVNNNYIRLGLPCGQAFAAGKKIK